jgi:hypothetical protein
VAVLAHLIGLVLVVSVLLCFIGFLVFAAPGAGRTPAMRGYGFENTV